MIKFFKKKFKRTKVQRWNIRKEGGEKKTSRSLEEFQYLKVKAYCKK